MAAAAAAAAGCELLLDVGISYRLVRRAFDDARGECMSASGCCREGCWAG